MLMLTPRCGAVCVVRASILRAPDEVEEADPQLVSLHATTAPCQTTATSE